VRCESGTWLFPEHIDGVELAELARIALGEEAARLTLGAPAVAEAAYALALSTRGLTPDALQRVVPARAVELCGAHACVARGHRGAQRAPRASHGASL
jgi:hypothetical protein